MLVLLRLVNLAVPSLGIKFKKSPMPFVQMENISHFLRACQEAPLSLHQHDTFLTVDLYEQKDPAQVLQCLGAFSRAANSVNPSRFPSTIGVKVKSGVVSPQRTGPTTPRPARDRGASVTSNRSSVHGSARPSLPLRGGDLGTGRMSPTKSPSPTGGSPSHVSSWSKKEQEGATAPAWNIAQYGYMGGASQGNLGITFGGRRQITSAGPTVPSLADKERARREKLAEEERQREEVARQQKAQLQAEEERARREEEQRWEEETQRARQEERQRAEEESRRWEEQEREWKRTEEKRRKEEAEAEARLAEERRRTRSRSDVKLTGQLLSQYQADQGRQAAGSAGEDEYRSRVEELERELELARQRETEYERERQARARGGGGDERVNMARKARSRSRPGRPPSRQDSWRRDEREYVGAPRTRDQGARTAEAALEPQPGPPSQPHSQQGAEPGRDERQATTARRPLPDPRHGAGTGTAGRPLPDPTQYSSPHQTYAPEVGGTAERDTEDRRRAESQATTKAGGWASKSLLEREMEMERQRQREWEEAQKETAAAAAAAPRSQDGVDGVGGRWDVSQWSGYTGGDNQNRGALGIGAGRRPIGGPRPPPGSHR